ncbi:MAG: hypothetical protein ACOYJF_08750 [Prevotella sp.]|jgi:purine nucleosidase
MKQLLLLTFVLLFFPGASLAGEPQTSASVLQQQKKVRVVIDNDYCGDPDGLFQLAHQLLCSTTDIRGIVGGHLSANAGFTQSNTQATESCDKVRELVRLMGVGSQIPVVPGSETGLTSILVPAESEGARLIVREARQCTPEHPLYVLCGASLTNIASAWLMDSTIQDRVVLVWIGGQEYPELGMTPPPGYTQVEYNLNLSIPAGQVIFNRSKIRIWQVPRNAYRQCMYSLDEARRALASCGKAGSYLMGQLEKVIASCEKYGIPMGETYILGDSPLVLLTSLQSGFEADPASSDYRYVQAPLIRDDGSYAFNHQSRLIRVYTRIDTRLMFGDMEAKFARYLATSASAR